MFPFRFWSACLLGLTAALVLILPSRARAAEEDTKLALRTAAALYEGIHSETLPNGLRVLLKPIPASPAVTTMVVYKVGSADEDKEFTGLSHYLEHLMFKGTNKLMPGDIDRLCFRQGGSNNAYTNTDLTAYHFTFPANRWLPALQIEADRMRNLLIDTRHEFEKEKGAVINELTGNEDSPWDLEYKAILPLLFGSKAPYGHPVIGESKHVRDATAAVIKAHYDRWYHPNNAVLVVCGGFDPDEALAAIKKLFGPIPAAKLPPRKELVEIELDRPSRKQLVSKFSSPRLLMGFNTVRSGDPDHIALNVVEAVLSRGKSSRLYKALVEGAELASAVSADHSPGRYPGWFGINVELLPGKDRERAEKIVLEELRKLSETPVPAAELARIKRLLLAHTVFSLEGVQKLADTIATGVTNNDLDWVRNQLPRGQAVTPADIQRVVKKYLVAEKRAVVWSVPPERGKDPAPQEASARASRTPPSPARTKEGRELAQRIGEKGAATGFDLKKAQRVELPNGLVLLLFENHLLPTVEAHAIVLDAALLEPEDRSGVATLTGYLLDEGTTRRSGTSIAEAIEDVGGTLSLGGSSGSVRVLASDRTLGLELLLECLSQPAFPKEAFTRNKARLLAEIGELATLPESRAQQIYRSTLYGKHPLGRPSLGTRKAVTALTPEDCAAFHRRVFVPNNTLLAIVGDFDSKQVIEEVKRLTAGWKRAELDKPKWPAPIIPEKFQETILSMPEASQLHFFMGHPGIRRNDPDYYKLLVLDYVLGVGPGFTDRLSSRLRDREGLAYTVTASITNSARQEPGLFTCYIGTDKENFARVKKEFLEELHRIRKEKPSEKEVEDVKMYLLGSQLLQYASNGGIADQLVAIERYKLGFNYLEEYRKAIGAVTSEEVQAMARKHLHPERMVIVAAGAVDGKGKPIQEKKP